MNGKGRETPKNGLMRRIRRSVFRGPVVPTTDRERRWVVFNTLLLHIHPVIAVVIIPVAAALFFALLPYLGYRDGIAGVWMIVAHPEDPIGRDLKSQLERALSAR